MNGAPLEQLVGRTLTGWASDPRGLTLHFGGRRFVIAPGEGLLVEIDDEPDEEGGAQ